MLSLYIDWVLALSEHEPSCDTVTYEGRTSLLRVMYIMTIPRDSFFLFHAAEVHCHQKGEWLLHKDKLRTRLMFFCRAILKLMDDIFKGTEKYDLNKVPENYHRYKSSVRLWYNKIDLGEELDGYGPYYKRGYRKITWPLTYNCTNQEQLDEVPGLFLELLVQVKSHRVGINNVELDQLLVRQLCNVCKISRVITDAIHKQASRKRR